jgi:hypothetical protein
MLATAARIDGPQQSQVACPLTCPDSPRVDTFAKCVSCLPPAFFPTRFAPSDPIRALAGDRREATNLPYELCSAWTPNAACA